MTPWSPLLRAKIGMSRAALLRRVTPKDGELIINGLDLTPEERRDALNICKPASATHAHKPQLIIYDPTRRTWFLAAWILGASWRQLATLHGISHPSVAQSAKKGLTPDILAEKARINAPRMSMERLEILRVVYLEYKSELSPLDPITVAHRLDELAA